MPHFRGICDIMNKSHSKEEELSDSKKGKVLWLFITPNP